MSVGSGDRLETLMRQAVEAGVRHVDAGGLPFVAVLAGHDGSVSGPGVNLVRETGDASAHAEIVVMRQALHDGGRTSLHGMTLLATGEPCALCYRFAAGSGVDAVFYAVDRDTAAEWGFDYRTSYDVWRTDQVRLAQTAQHLPVDRGLEPFTRYTRLHSPKSTDSTDWP